MGALSYDDYVMSYDYVKEKQYDYDSVKLYFNEIKKIPLLSKEEEYDLLVKAKEGDIEARNRLIEANLKLVVFIAKRYPGYGYSFLDLIQEGNLGLEKAIEKYDLNSNYRFATYAGWWIKQSISRSLENDSRTIRIPVYLIDRLKTYRKQKEQLENENKKEYSEYELAAELNVPVEEIHSYEILLHDSVSYDVMVRSDGEPGSELSVFLISEENVEKTVMDATLKEEVIKCITETDLTMSEVFILIKRYGLDGNTPLKLEEAAKMLSINKQRASQIEMTALKKLNTEMTRKRLHIYLYPNDEIILDNGKKEIIFDEFLERLSDDLKKFFTDKELSLEEIKILTLSLGLIDGVEVPNTEIARIIDKPLKVIKSERKRALEKIQMHQKILRKK